MQYKRLEKGEIIQAGDETDDCADPWRDQPKWKQVNQGNIGDAAPDPRYPSHRQYGRPMNYKLPTGYAETMDKLKRPDDWDIPGIIADASERLRRESDDGETLAVLDTLTFRMRDIANLISQGHAKHITPDTIRQAADIAAMLAGDAP